MTLAHNPADIVALKQIYYKLNGHISQGTYHQAAAALADGSITDALDALLKSPNLSENASMRVKKLKENIVKLPEMEPGHAVQYILDKLGYGEYLKKAGGEGLYLESLLQIVESMKAIASRTNTYQELLERNTTLADIAEAARCNAAANAVTLSTVALTKGLEFKKVFIIDLFEGRFPAIAAVSENNEGKKELMEEERRLFYVAVTRAAKQVELIYAARINGERVKPSRFVRELLPLAPLRKARPNRPAKPVDPNAPVKATFEKRVATRRPTGMKAAQQKLPTFENFNLVVGMDVAHKAFGQGVISAYDIKRDIVAVKFPKHGLKTFAATFCVNGGVIKKPDPDGDNAGTSTEVSADNA
jgi:DNA helicase II / ATP-dependent DNA helicase PcrA